MIEIDIGEATYRIGFDSQGYANVVPDTIGYLLEWPQGVIKEFCDLRGWTVRDVEEKP